MDDLISRKWLIECVEEGWIKFETEKDKNKFIRLVRDTAPSADAVEVVRCKDCKHYFTSSLEMAKLHGAECVIRPRRMMPDDFCSYGKRKDERH